MNNFALSSPAPAAAQLPLELALAHALLMKSVGQADRLLDSSALSPASPARLRATEAVRGLGNLTARLMNRTRRGTVLLMRLPPERRASLDMGSVARNRADAPRPAAGAAPKLHAAPGQARGHLNNGNPSGDFLAAPRCGARTRAGCSCRQPAMTNGRCRFHGGKSTGPRTAAGLARSRTARLVHGGRTRAVISLRSAGAHSARRLTRLIRVLSARPAGHGVDRSDVALSSVGATGRSPVYPSNRSAGDLPVAPTVVAPAGHGLHRSNRIAPVGATPCGSPAAGRPRGAAPTSRTAPPAGHGLHRPVFARTA